ncbi:MAG: adenylosuccinate synthase, partial [Gemmatimonadota bacterium]|nr:adenylosuccinate synthase [Gemmatimonadota bacterium]
MAVRILVGTQWGDEGKGKVIDALAGRASVMARYGGGPNAGHTVVIGGKKTILHHVPSGVLHERCLCLLGNGVVVDPVLFMEEIRALEADGIDCRDRILVSPRAHVILPTHRLLDRLAEDRRGAEAIGTTGKGIGPAYGDKVLREGLRAGELALPERVEAKVRADMRRIHAMQEEAGEELADTDALVEEALESARAMAGMVEDTGVLLRERIEAGEEVLLEGAQGTLLDLDHGTYPFVTSSSSVSGGACTGCGVPPTSVDAVWGVTKAYVTRVGNGPFPTELMEDPTGDLLRSAGAEFGSTTGRPRRCGWFDGVAARYSTRLNGLTAQVVTKLDVLTGIDPLRICVAYRIDGRETTEFPDTAVALGGVTPVYEEHPGWTESLRGARSPEELPDAARSYLRRLEELSGCAV